MNPGDELAILGFIVVFVLFAAVIGIIQIFGGKDD